MRSGGKPRDEREQRRDRERGALAVLDRVRLRRDLEQREHDEDLDDDADRDAGRAERRLEHGAEERRADHLAAEHEQAGCC